MDIPNSFLFTAYYDLGGGRVVEYRQEPGDKSVQDPEKNAFYDILYRPHFPLEQLFAFQLTAIPGVQVLEGTPNSVAVNLRTGQFDAEGKIFSLHNELIDEYDGKPSDHQLLYYRNPAPFQRRKLDEETGDVTIYEGYTLSYVLGWKAKVRRKHTTARGTRYRTESLKKFVSITGVPVIVNRYVIKKAEAQKELV